MDKERRCYVNANQILIEIGLPKSCISAAPTHNLFTFSSRTSADRRDLDEGLKLRRLRERGLLLILHSLDIILHLRPITSHAHPFWQPTTLIREQIKFHYVRAYFLALLVRTSS